MMRRADRLFSWPNTMTLSTDETLATHAISRIFIDSPRRRAQERRRRPSPIHQTAPRAQVRIPPFPTALPSPHRHLSLAVVRRAAGKLYFFGTCIRFFTCSNLMPMQCMSPDFELPSCVVEHLAYHPKVLRDAVMASRSPCTR